MSQASRVDVLGAFLRLGAIEALAYRAQAFLWLLSTTMPLVMIAFFGAVTREGPIGRYGHAEVLAYFLATFIVRSLTASWISWAITVDIREGSLAPRLLLPVHPLVAYVAEAIGAMPVRILGAVGMAVVMLFALGRGALTHDPALWSLFTVSTALAWVLSLCVSASLGALAFFVGSSAKAMDAWIAGLFVFGGYVVPLDLFPAWLRAVIDWLPFRYQIGLPVELMVGLHGREEALWLVVRQVGFVAAAALVTLTLWRRGLARYAAFGG